MTFSVNFDELTQVQQKIAALSDEVRPLTEALPSVATGYAALDASIDAFTTGTAEKGTAIVERLDQLKESVRLAELEFRMTEAGNTTAIHQVGHELADIMQALFGQ